MVPKIVFLDVDVHALNTFLMRERPGKKFIISLVCLPSHDLAAFFVLSIVMRRSKVIGNNFGLLYRDVAFLPKSLWKEIYVSRSSGGWDSPTICIEIKAKQGYLNDDEPTAGVQKCRFCYFQVSPRRPVHVRL